MGKLVGSLAVILMTINVNAQGVGIGITTPRAAFNVAENKTVLFGRDTSGGGSKLMWIPFKAAFRAGIVGTLPSYSSVAQDSTIWNADSIGRFSFAAGHQNVASSTGTFSAGVYNSASGIYGVALGYKNASKGYAAFSAGSNNIASESIAVGTDNNASASSVAIGRNNQADLSASAIGYKNLAYYSSAAIGTGNTATGEYAYAFGNGNDSKGGNTATLGIGNLATGEGSSAIGRANFANSYLSTVIGTLSDSIHGVSRTAWVNTDPLFTIGGGRSISNRKNVMMILKNGKTGFGTNYPEAQLHLSANSSDTDPSLLISEQANDYARINFKNYNPGNWRQEAYIQTFGADNDLGRFNFYFSKTGYIFSLRGNGNAILTGTLYQNSDERLKQNITPLKNTLNKISRLNAYTYSWRDKTRGNEEQLGLLAQEVEKEFPQLVITDAEGKKSVAYGNMVPVLLQAIKELQLQIDELGNNRHKTLSKPLIQ